MANRPNKNVFPNAKIAKIGPRYPVESIDFRQRDLIIRIADWTDDKDAPCYDVEFYQAGFYDWNKSHSFDTSILGAREAKKRAIEHAQQLIAANL